MPAPLVRVKRITSHVGKSRWFATLQKEGDIVGYIPREVATPYASSPTHAVYLDAHGRTVIVAETAHKVYDVFLTGDRKVYTPEEETEILARPGSLVWP